MYNLILLTASPFLFGAKHVSRIVILYIFILILFLVNYYTDFKIFFNGSCSPAALEQGAFISPFIQALIISGINGVYVSKMLLSSATQIQSKRHALPQKNYKDCANRELQSEESDDKHQLQALVKLALSNPETLVIQFNQHYPLLFDQLLAVNPRMTTTEYKTLILIKLGFATKDISSIEFISVRTVETRKNRIRKNFGLSPHTNIYRWLNAFPE
ncbi:helix-turn-helix transcriptional regulator [Sphingobacterium bambusae]|uniref:Helix-turn-helix transcriptional regulator n=1 Tax=Sphingobacterium bambusae TaxID=662858 RepID=A0ABW6BE80_9SPHI|nr:hypothetical protein [Sphingobacterium bambusae]WPL48765.1 hypothetical protein SCB77_22705 [Sphingobacterium bambusae]